MNINNWIEAQKIIINGKEALKIILQQYVEDDGRMLGYDIAIILSGDKDIDMKYVPVHLQQMFNEIENDVVEAYKYIGIDWCIKKVIS